jgi:hypothetical protein
MSFTAFRLVLTSPAGVVFDASSYLDFDGLGSVNSSPESDLAILTHSDLALSLDNSDGTVESFFQGAKPSDLYDVTLDREHIGKPGVWDRMFGGVIDHTTSLTYDDMNKTVHVLAYSYTKGLERTPADGTAKASSGLIRQLKNKTASITSGTSTLVFIAGETADLEVGDIVELNDATRIETFTIDRIISTTQVATLESASKTYVDAFVTVRTKGFHDKTPKVMLQKIADESAFGFNDLVTGTAMASFPISTPQSIFGLNLSGVPLSLTIVSGAECATFPSTHGTNRKIATSPTSGWVDGVASNTPQLDWTPYMTTEPGTIQALVGAGNDSGSKAPDHTTGWVYYNFLGVGQFELHRRQNSGADINLGPWSGFLSGRPPTLVNARVEFAPPNNRVFLSYYNIVLDATRKFRYYDVGGVAFADIDLNHSGDLRWIRYGSGGILVLVNNATDAEPESAYKHANEIEFWDASGPTKIRTFPWPNRTDNILTWTMKTWGAGGTVGGFLSRLWFTFLFERFNETWLAVYDARGAYTSWSFVAEYRISSVVSNRVPSDNDGVSSFQTIITLAGGEELAVGYAGGQWFVLSTFYAGVIPYSNFSDNSCGKAARDIAVILNSIVDIDYVKVMTVRNRRALGSGPVAADLGVPLSSMRQPISDLYRGSVSVTGENSSGVKIQEIQGASGDSARRLDVSSKLITTSGMALACALTTLEFVEQIREQRTVTVVDDGTPIAAFDRVTMDGKTWFIYKLSTDLEQRTHDLVLLELVP